jgi:hypothetical protein
MAYDRGRVRRWIEQRRARLRRQDFVLFHAAPLFVLVAAPAPSVSVNTFDDGFPDR